MLLLQFLTEMSQLEVAGLRLRLIPFPYVSRFNFVLQLQPRIAGYSQLDYFLSFLYSEVFLFIDTTVTFLGEREYLNLFAFVKQAEQKKGVNWCLLVHANAPPFLDNSVSVMKRNLIVKGKIRKCLVIHNNPYKYLMC